MARVDAAVRDERAAAVERPSMLTVGTVVWLTSELMFFGALFAAAFTLRAEAGGRWPAGDAEVDVLLAGALTVILVASSVTQHAATSAAEHGDLAATRRWLAVTVALGAVFVGGQLFEWSTLDFSISSHAFGSTFYTLTGFHLLHVTAGVVALAVVLARAVRQPVRLRPGLDVVTAYWHFVDVVWLAVFGTLYLLP
jgi:cytochrome c oxidase subunit 3